MSDEGKIYTPEQPAEQPAEAAPEEREPEIKALIIDGYTDQPEEFENRIAEFFNSAPPKQILHTHLSSMDIRHFFLIIYREVENA